LWFLSALALSLAGLSKDAEAGCGDYVTVAGDHSALMHGSPVHGNSPRSPDTECHGPNCQRQTPAPVNPWRNVPTISSSEHACLARTFDNADQRTFWGIFDTPNRPLAGFRPDIEHPPRLA
jgi:hypothetical protein